MPAEAVQNAPIETTRGIPQKSELAVVQPNEKTVTPAAEKAMKRWGVDSIDTAAKADKNMSLAIVGELKDEVKKLKDAVKKKEAANGISEARFTGSGYDAQKAQAEKKTAGAIETEQTKQISQINEQGKVVMIDSGKDVSELSDADIMIKANGFLGVREAYMNFIGSWMPKKVREETMPRTGNGKLDQFIEHPDNPIKATWRLVKAALDPRSFTRDMEYRDAIDHGDADVIGNVRSGKEWYKPEYAVQLGNRRTSQPNASVTPAAEPTLANAA